MTGKPKAILFAFLAAVFYAINVPVSKILLREVGQPQWRRFFIWVRESV